MPGVGKNKKGWEEFINKAMDEVTNLFAQCRDWTYRHGIVCTCLENSKTDFVMILHTYVYIYVYMYIYS